MNHPIHSKDSQLTLYWMSPEENDMLDPLIASHSTLVSKLMDSNDGHPVFKNRIDW
jgi:hypothetical protein